MHTYTAYVYVLSFDKWTELIYSLEMGNVAIHIMLNYCGKEVDGVAKIFQNYKMKVHVLFKHGYAIAIVCIRYCQC